MITKEEVIKAFDLSPLAVEGGMYREVYTSDRMLDGRSACSVIFYLLSGDTFSHMHRLTTDEVYYFFMGDPVEMLWLSPEGEHKKIILGQDIMNGQCIQTVVKAGTWQGSHLMPGGGKYGFALLGTSMAPAYSQEDYEHGDRAFLCSRYPKASELIEQLTGAPILK